MAEKTFELVTYEKSNRIAWITIRNESRMNALSTGVLNGLYDSFEEADNDDDVLVVVLTGAGGRAFCAGMDLKEMTERDQSGAAATSKNGFDAVGKILKPVIGCVDGFALAGGMQIAARCDFRIATQKSTFGMPEPLRSLVPINLMDTMEIGFVPLGNALWIILSGEHFSAEEAHRIGFVQWLVPDRDAMMAEAEKRAEILEAVRAAGGQGAEERRAPAHEPADPAHRCHAAGAPARGQRPLVQEGRRERGPPRGPEGLRREARPELEGPLSPRSRPAISRPGRRPMRRSPAGVGLRLAATCDNAAM